MLLYNYIPTNLTFPLFYAIVVAQHKREIQRGNCAVPMGYNDIYSTR